MDVSLNAKLNIICDKVASEAQPKRYPDSEMSILSQEQWAVYIDHLVWQKVTGRLEPVVSSCIYREAMSQYINK
jgi:hypothetical protein